MEGLQRIYLFPKVTVSVSPITSGNKLVSEEVNLCVRFEVLKVVTMKNGVFWDVMPCGSCTNRRFGGA
jgi:hypothetical protein